MADFVYTKAKQLLLAGDIDFDEAGDDIRVLLVMANTTADTEEDVDTLSAITTLDEFDDTGYSRVALANQATAEDEANDRGEFDADDVTFSGLNGDGSRNVQAAIVYKHVTDDTDSVPIAYIDSGGFPLDPGSGDLTIQWNAEGIVQAT